MEPMTCTNLLSLLDQGPNHYVAAAPVKAEVPTGMAGALGRVGVPVEGPRPDLNCCRPPPPPRSGRVEEGSPCR